MWNLKNIIFLYIWNLENGLFQALSSKHLLALPFLLVLLLQNQKYSVFFGPQKILHENAPMVIVTIKALNGWLHKSFRSHRFPMLLQNGKQMKYIESCCCTHSLFHLVALIPLFQIEEEKDFPHGGN